MSDTTPTRGRTISVQNGGPVETNPGKLLDELHRQAAELLHALGRARRALADGAPLDVPSLMAAGDVLQEAIGYADQAPSGPAGPDALAVGRAAAALAYAAGEHAS